MLVCWLALTVSKVIYWLTHQRTLIAPSSGAGGTKRESDNAATSSALAGDGSSRVMEHSTVVGDSPVS